MLPAVSPTATGARSKRRRRLPLLAVAAAATVLLSGCLEIKGQWTSQRDVVGDLVVQTDLCLDHFGPGGDGDCDGSNESVKPVQLFVGYLVPQWLDAPAGVALTGDVANQNLRLAPRYAEGLTQRLAPSAGLRWVGYRSTTLAPIAAHVDTQATTTAVFGTGADAEAIAPLATVVGYHEIDPSQPDSTYEACFGEQSEGLRASCTNDRTGVYAGGDAEQEIPDVWGPEPIKLNTAAFVAPAPADVMPGQTATLQFAVKTSRADEAAASLPIEATSAIPGAVVEAPLALPLGGEDAPVTVTVDVPAGTKPGEYAVTFASQNGLRKATAKLNVVAPAPAPAAQAPASEPTATPGTLLQTASLLKTAIERTPVVAKLRAGQPVSVPVQLPARGFVRVSVTAVKTYGWKNPPVLAVATGPTSKPGELTMRLRATKQGRKVLKTRKSVPATLVIRLWGRTGKTVSMPVEFSIR